MIKIAPGQIKVRTMRSDDLAAIVGIDEEVTKRQRRDYYEAKLRRCQEDERLLAASLVAEVSGKVVGFIMGQLYVGEFGIPESTATLDTIGVARSYGHQGIARALFEQFASNLRAARVETIHTLVNLRESDLLRFFDRVGFRPGRTVSLELPLQP